MPLGRAVPYLIGALLALSTAACATVPTYAPTSPVAAAPSSAEVTTLDTSDAPTARMPREIRLGAADMVIQRVEADVSREEVAAAIAPLLSNATICMRWPALWIAQARRNVFLVRYDLMARDWGEASAANAEARMEEFVQLGFLTERPGQAERTVEYSLTEAGAQYLSGVIEPGRRPRFCAPAERRLVEITDMEWGEYPCGTLRVRFSHVSDTWPSWARTEATRERLAGSWPAVGAPAQGSVSLGRIWYARASLPVGFQNGALMSACYDSSRRQIVGDDLNLTVQEIE